MRKVFSMVGVASFRTRESTATGFSVDAGRSALLQKLHCIWTEIGINDDEKERRLLELDAEIAQIYRRKVEEASDDKAKLTQTVTAKEAELAALVASLGEHNIHSKMEKRTSSLIDQFARVTPLLDELRPRKQERERRMSEIKSQIGNITGELTGVNQHFKTSALFSEQNDLSLRKLNEYQTQLQGLRKEKSERIEKILGYVHRIQCLCPVLGIDFSKELSRIHPSLQNTDSGKPIDISNSTIDGVEGLVVGLESEKKSRLSKLKDTMTSLWELWEIMDSSEAERGRFGRVLLIVGTPDNEIVDRGSLSLDILENTRMEFERLSKLKSSRMKELVSRKRTELEEICKETHIIPTQPNTEDHGTEPTKVLANIDAEIFKAKQQLKGRKDIIDRMRKWVAACEEEEWLQEYNNDPRRYSVSRGAHLNLRRAERARITITKIPGFVVNLMNRVLAWEDEKNIPFMYDGVRLTSILKEYQNTQQQKKEEKRFRKKSNAFHRQQNEILTPTHRYMAGALTPTHRRDSHVVRGSLTPTHRYEPGRATTPTSDGKNKQKLRDLFGIGNKINWR